MSAFSENLKELRTEKGLLQRELADKLGTYKNAIVRWENGYRVPDFDTLIKIADFFDVSLDVLLGRKDY